MFVPVAERGIQYYLLPNGEKRYRVRYVEGKVHRSRSFRRLQDARRFHLQVRSSSERGERLLPANAQDLTLAEFALQTWAPKAERRLAAKTYKIHKQIYNKHILGSLGAMPIANLDAEDLVEWQDHMEESGVGNAAQIKAISILSSIFKEAARRPRLTGVQSNPVALLDKPSTKRRHTVKIFSPEEVERVRHQLLTHPHHRRGMNQHNMAIQDATLLSLLYMAGIRPGEALALKTDSIKNELHITSAVSDGVLVDKTKTKQDRLVPIRPALKKDLEAYISTWNLGPGDLLFSRKDGSPWNEATWKNWRRRHFDRALSELGMGEARPYDIGRHSCASLFLASGVSLPRTSEILGHSVRVLSEVYAGTINEYKDKPSIDAEKEIEKARQTVFGTKNPSTGI